MLDWNKLKNAQTVYRYNAENYLMWCDVIHYPRSPTGWGFIPEDQSNKVFSLLEEDAERMFHSVEDAEQIELFEDELFYAVD